MFHRPLKPLFAAAFLALAGITRASRTDAAPKAGPPPMEHSCRAAVQEFYNWYLPRLMREVRTPAMTQALNARSQNFSAELHRRLAEDTAAAAKSPDEIVGLDFEPFVNSQDPAPRYVAKRSYRAGKGLWVEVHGVIDGKESEDPDVIPELILSRGHWVFVNFHYPAQEAGGARSNLLGVLKELRDARRKPAGSRSKRR